MFSQVVVGLVLVLAMGLCQQLSVTRRANGDRVSLGFSGGSSCTIRNCSPPNSSYLVEEMQCVQDTMLQRNCFASSLLAFIAAGSDMLIIELGGFQAPRGNCTITQVEVVRGTSTFTSIDQDAFSINDDSSISVSMETYSRGDLNGEIYRLNFTCNNGTSNERGCVVFKLNGTTNLSEGKFNEGVSTAAVPFNCPTTASIPLTSSVATTTDEPGILEDSTFQTILIASSGGIGVLLLLISIMCAVICCLWRDSSSKDASTLRIREMELQAAREEGQYQLHSPSHNILGVETANKPQTDPNGLPPIEQEEEEDHTYTDIEGAQAEAEEVRQKEATRAKFQYASVTFNTFKPQEEDKTKPPLYPVNEDSEHATGQRLPSFARNFNPTANRAMLARSYEIVTPMKNLPGASGITESTEAVVGGLQQEEYHKLMHPERKMTGVSQRKFSITTTTSTATGAGGRDVTRTNYSQLELNPSGKETAEAKAKDDPQELGVKKIKPVAKKRTLLQKSESSQVNKIPSYSVVQKPKAPPLPPRCADLEEDDEQAQERRPEVQESHYKVPRGAKQHAAAAASRNVEASKMYDQVPSQLRVAWSCENIDMQYNKTQQYTPSLETTPHALYDTPALALSSSALGLGPGPGLGLEPRVVRSQHSLVHDGSSHDIFLSNANSMSMGSYIDMSGNSISYV